MTTRHAWLALALLGCDIDNGEEVQPLPGKVAPLPQPFTLSVDGTVAGQPMTFTVHNAPANRAVRVGAAYNGSITPGVCPPALQGECLDIDGPNGVTLLPVTLNTDGTGFAEATLTVPAGIPNGTTLAFQAAEVSQAVGSTPVRFTVNPPIVCTNDPTEPNTDAASAPDLLDGLMGSTCGGTADWDWFALDVLAGDTVTIDVSFTHVVDDVDIDVVLFDAPQINDRNVVFLNAITIAASNTDNESITHTAQADGTLYLAVYNWLDVWDAGSTSDGDYTLTVTGP